MKSDDGGVDKWHKSDKCMYIDLKSSHVHTEGLDTRITDHSLLMIRYLYVASRNSASLR